MSLSLRFFSVGLLAASLCTAASAEDARVPVRLVTLETSDGVTVYGDWFATPNARASILLFHQGGSNAKGEYEPIVPALLAQNFSVLAIDQRRGGQTYGQYNRTVAKDPQRTSYCAVTPDLEAAVDFVKGERPNNPMILWGSSYSAALILRLAAPRQDEFAGVLAFSPASGGPMADCQADPVLADLKIPILILRPANEAVLESVVAQSEIARDHGHTVYVADPGAHGSSMLVKERVGAEVSETWHTVNTFLDSLVD